MTVDELAKHGLRVQKTGFTINGRTYAPSEASQTDHAALICAALEPIAPPDVAQAARVLLEHDWPDAALEAAFRSHMVRSESPPSCYRYVLNAALRVIAGDAP